MSTPDQPADPARDPYAGQPSPYDPGYGTSGTGQPSPHEQGYGTPPAQPSPDDHGYGTPPAQPPPDDRGYGTPPAPPSPYDHGYGGGYGAPQPSPYDQGYGAAYGQPPAVDPYGQSAYGQPPAYGQHPASGQPAAYPGAPAAWGAALYAPAYGYPKNSLGVWSLVLSLVGLVLCGALTGIPAIITGVLSRQAAARGEADNGGMALAGIIIGSLATAWGVIVFFAAFVPEISGPYGY